MKESSETPPPKGEGFRPLQDPYIILLFYMFSCNAILTLFAILVASIPYYYYFGYEFTREGFLVTGANCILFYIFFFVAFSTKHIKTAIALWILWWLSFSIFIGFISASIYNISLIQWLLISWAQSIAMIVYIRTMKIEWYFTLSLLSAISICVWTLSIYGFIVENDWIMSGVIAGLSVLLVAYNMWQIKHVKGNFDLSWEQSMMVCLQYYCPL